MTEPAEGPTLVPLGVANGDHLRVCLDLNFLFAVARAEALGRTETKAARTYREMLMSNGPIGPAQIVVSEVMLTHLEVNLARSGIPEASASAFTRTLREATELGAGSLTPVVLFGSTAVSPSLDPDPDDSHVLTVARVTKAHVIVTDDRRHFVGARLLRGKARRDPLHPEVVVFSDVGESLLFDPREIFSGWYGLDTEKLPLLPPRAQISLPRRELFSAPTQGRTPRGLPRS